MKTIVIILSLFFYMACDGPQRTRNPYGNIASQDSFNFSDNPSNQSPGDNNSDDSSNDDSSDDNNDNSNNTTTGFEDCSLSYKYYERQIGYFGLCQSTKDETRFKLKMANTDTSVGTCFVPIHILSNNTSFNLGIAECVHNEGNKVYEMTLAKNRSEPTNGVMVLKYSTLNNYMACMSAKSHFMNNIIYDTQCYYNSQGNPNTYANCLCSKFASNYKGSYLQIKF